MFVRSDGPVEAEKDRAEVSFRPFPGIRFKLGLDIDDEGGADSREQASLGIWSALHGNPENIRTLTKIRVVLRSSLYFFIYSASYSVASRLYMV